jgi:hypothetical protein
MYNLFVLTGDEWELVGVFHRKAMMMYYVKMWEKRGWNMEYTAW